MINTHAYSMHSIKYMRKMTWMEIAQTKQYTNKYIGIQYNLSLSVSLSLSLSLSHTQTHYNISWPLGESCDRRAGSLTILRTAPIGTSWTFFTFQAVTQIFTICASYYQWNREQGRERAGYTAPVAQSLYTGIWHTNCDIIDTLAHPIYTTETQIALM